MDHRRKIDRVVRHRVVADAVAVAPHDAAVPASFAVASSSEKHVHLLTRELLRHRRCPAPPQPRGVRAWSIGTPERRSDASSHSRGAAYASRELTATAVVLQPGRIGASRPWGEGDDGRRCHKNQIEENTVACVSPSHQSINQNTPKSRNLRSRSLSARSPAAEPDRSLEPRKRAGQQLSCCVRLSAGDSEAVTSDHTAKHARRTGGLVETCGKRKGRLICEVYLCGRLPHQLVCVEKLPYLTYLSVRRSGDEDLRP